MALEYTRIQTRWVSMKLSRGTLGVSYTSFSIVHTRTCGRGGVQTRLSVFSLMYGTPANSAESQQLEAWPASIYGHLKEWTFPIEVLGTMFPIINVGTVYFLKSCSLVV